LLFPCCDDPVLGVTEPKFLARKFLERRGNRRAAFVQFGAKFPLKPLCFTVPEERVDVQVIGGGSFRRGQERSGGRIAPIPVLLAPGEDFLRLKAQVPLVQAWPLLLNVEEHLLQPWPHLLVRSNGFIRYCNAQGGLDALVFAVGHTEPDNRIFPRQVGVPVRFCCNAKRLGGLDKDQAPLRPDARTVLVQDPE